VFEILTAISPIEINAIAAIFSWDVIPTAGFLGVARLWIADRTGFMPALDPPIPLTFKGKRHFFSAFFIAGGMTCTYDLQIIGSTKDISLRWGERSKEEKTVRSTIWRLFLFGSF
jgi:hypothetical protein